MKRIFLVDDEPLVTDTIKNLVDWNRYGMDICGVANDGVSAKAAILEMRPNLVITDIRMPGMNGLDLIASVQRKLPDTLFAIISGYNDFAYIRAALRLNVVDYLDKPVTVEKIESMLQEVQQIFQEKDALAEKKYTDFFDGAAEGEAVRKGVEGQIKPGFQDQLGLLLRTAEWQRAEEAVEKILQQMEELRPNPDLVRHICLKIIYLSISICSESGKEYTKDGRPLLPHVEIASMNRAKDVRAWTQETFHEIVNWQKERRDQVGHKDIVKAKRYIDEHYGEAITLQMLADMCYMNQNYFSAVFRDQVGMNYVKYLNMVRMEHAKSMLREGKKIKVISEKCGFQNTRYFSEKFKSYTGVTPEQYRSGNS